MPLQVHRYLSFSGREEVLLFSVAGGRRSGRFDVIAGFGQVLVEFLLQRLLLPRAEGGERG